MLRDGLVPRVCFSGDAGVGLWTGLCVDLGEERNELGGAARYRCVYRVLLTVLGVREVPIRGTPDTGTAGPSASPNSGISHEAGAAFLNSKNSKLQEVGPSGCYSYPQPGELEEEGGGVGRNPAVTRRCGVLVQAEESRERF